MLRVLVIAGHRLVREAMSSLLSQERDLLVVGSVDTDRRRIPAVVELCPDVAVVDIDCENNEGIAAAEELRRCVPDSAVLMLTGWPTPAHLDRALGASPRGLLAKDASARSLLDGVRRLGRGEMVIEPDLAVTALRARQNPLTQREQDVLRLAESGVPVGEIASRLYLSAGTVRNYLSFAISKTGARNRIEAFGRARRAGWI